ncbi:serine/threonine-protein phosphatase [Streptomyces radicis]|uniref:Serine/threonine-protein phosphatase n=1 Tax=Streptomyces radicis TaxID=1750517 RepID=A0A3A9WZG1_9ACTN|nr:serine/threonine-protein phosphatase [Streptomyces radicis]RKN26384.1 serine/threonine-protein phosphatase [Streptomyces radicis]
MIDSPPPGIGGRLGGVRTTAPWGVRAWVYAVLPAAFLLMGLLFDLFTPPHVTLTAFYCAAPLLAAPVLSFPVTALYGALATGAVVAQTYWHVSSAFKTSTVAVISVLALAINRIVAHRDQRVVSATNVAEAVQRAVVPEPPERAGSLRVAARYRAAQRNTLIGGDMYAARETPYGVRLLVGDVRGKGLIATEAVAVLLGAFREAAENEPRIDEVAVRLERALVRERADRASLDPVEGFATAVVVEVDEGPPLGIRFVNRGHPPPVLLGPGGEACYLAAEPALPLGLGDLLPGPERVEHARFPPGSQLLLYTDGLSEARNAVGTFYDPVARLNGRAFCGPTELLDAVVTDVVAHCDGAFDDDMALLAVHHPVPDGHPATPRAVP